MLKGKKNSLRRQSVRTKQMLESSDRELNITVINIYYNRVLQKNRSHTHSKRDGRVLLDELAVNVEAEKS